LSPAAESATSQIAIVVNGEALEIPSGLTLSALLARLKIDLQRVAVERNAHVVPRAEHAATALQAGDRLEIVTFVGGG
jgi:thiamine biosynthesis protein ThiS